MVVPHLGGAELCRHGQTWHSGAIPVFIESLDFSP
jgi:hypothetical protein